MFLTLALVATLTEPVVLARPALAAPKPPAVCPDDRPDEASAVLAAKLCKKKIKVSGLTSETDETYANPDSTITLSHRSRPVRVRRGSDWVPVDPTLRFGADGSVAPAAVPMDLKFSGGGDAPLLRAVVDGQELALGSPVGTLPTPQIAGATATYADVLPGIDLKVTASVDGFSEVLIVKDRSAAQNPNLKTLRFATTTKGVTARQLSGRPVEFVNVKGEAVFTSSAAEMWDAELLRSQESRTQAAPKARSAAGAEPATPAGKRAVMVTKAVSGGVEVVPDAAMLADPSTTFPVTIDPSWTLGKHGWFLLDSTDTRMNFSPNDYAQTGTWNGGANKRRSFWNIDLGGSGVGTYRQISSAHFKAYEVWSFNCDPKRVSLYRTPWLTGQESWSKPPANTYGIGDKNESHGWSPGGIGGASSCPAGTVDWDVTSALQDTQDSGGTTISFGMAAGSEADNTYWKKFDPNISLDITFNARPKVTALSTSPTTSCVSGASRPGINTTTPTLNVTGSNDDGDRLKAWIQLWTTNGAMITQFETAFADQGAVLQQRIPAGLLAEGGTYSWRAATDDGKTWSANGITSNTWSQFCEFTVDTVKPSAPFVASTDYPNDGQWNHGRYGQAGTFTLKPSGTGALAPVVQATGSTPCQASESADKAVDGTTANNSKWCSNVSSKWLQVTLASEQMVTNVVIRHAGAGGESVTANTKDYDIQTSVDGTTWTTALQVRGNTASVTNDRLPAPTRAVHVRLVVVTPAQDTTSVSRVYEVETYGLGVVPVAQATGSTACQVAESAAKAVDGITGNGSKWCSTDPSKWLQLQLASTRTITNVVVRHAGDGGEQAGFNTRDYDIQTSLDGANWSTATQVRGNTLSMVDHGLPAPVQATYVKVIVITPTQGVDAAARIYEVQPYNAPVSPTSDTAVYTYQLDTETAPKEIAAGGATTVQVTPTEDGSRSLTVRAKDKAGNLSDTTVYKFNVGKAGLTTPLAGSNIVKRAKLAIAGDSTYTRVTYQYRRGPGGTVYDIPLPHLVKANGSPLTSAPALLSDIGANASWNSVDTLGTVGGVVQVRARLFTASDADPSYDTQWITANVDPNGDGAAGTTVGPGSVNLLTGDYSLGSTDTDEFGLKVTRTASSRSAQAGWVKQGERLTANQQQISTDATGFVNGGTSTLTRSTVRGQGSSTDSLEIVPTLANGDTFAAVGGNNGALHLGMQAARRYRATGWIYVPVETGLNPAHQARGNRIVGFYKDATGYHEVASIPAGWTGAWQELTVDLAIPAGATEAFFRIYNGAAGGSGKKVYWDNLSVREVIAPFGPQWQGGVTDGTADHQFTGLEFPEAEVAQVTGAAGGHLTFAKNTAGGFFAEPGSEDLTLTKVSDTEYRLTELDGTTVSFTRQGAKFVVVSTWTANANSTTRYLYDTTDSRNLVKRVINPQEPGTGDCTAPVPAKGCEVLEYEYATTTTATATVPGDFVDHVRSVKVWNWDPVAATVNSVEVTRYAYDDQGRMRQVWDPRLASPLRTVYDYDAAGRVTKVSGAAELPNMFDFDADGKLQKLRRGALKAGTKDQLDGENATQMVYNVPMTRAAGGPYDMDWNAVGTWGQKDLPTDATAVFGPETSPGTSTASATVPGRDGYGPANVSYLNASGQQINTATPGGHIDTQEYDFSGNVVRSLEATNRELALGTLPNAEQYLGDLNLNGLDTASRANALSTVKTYSVDGLDLIETVGPTARIVLENDLVDPTGKLAALPAGSQVIARGRETNVYDESKPDGLTYHLVTTEREGAIVPGYPDADVRITQQGYGAEKGGASGWKLKKATSVTNDAGPSYVVFDDSARPLSSWGIGSEGTDARATKSIYYTAGANPDDSRCGGKPEWSGQPCVTGAAGAVTGHDAARMSTNLPVKFVEAYSRFGDPSVVSESAAGQTRRTTTTYDGADRITRVEITSTVGTAVPVLTTEYDPASGHVTKTMMGGSTITREYDLLGRLITYTDADGGVTRNEFDRFGKPAKVTDNTGSSTYAYDRVKEPRGFLTSVTDSVAGTFTASYSPDGQLVAMTYPGGVTRRDTLDSSLSPVARAYTRDSDGTVLYSESVVDNSQGHKVSHTYTGGSKTYGYDKVGRLNSVKQLDTAGACVTRTYSYDTRTNRTGQKSFGAGAGGACQSSTADSEGSHTYDSADRLTDSGYIYDAFGRTTNLPGGVNNSYYANDLVAGQETPDTRQAWTLDPKHRFRGFTTAKLVGGTWSDASSKLNHYGDDSDEARWIIEDTALGTVTRNVSGPDGDLAATTSATGEVKLSLSNLHGDVALTIDTALTSPEFHEFDEFGVPKAGQAGQRYGWLGGKQRSSEAQGGVVLMGVRLYQPALGRFLQVDPVAGGSATAYDYCNADPVNCTDLDGRWGWKKILGKVAAVASIAAIIPGPIGMIASGVAAVSYAATGNWKMAALMTAGIALSAVGAGAAVYAARAVMIVRAARATQGMSGGMRATRATSWLAGKMWVKRGAKKARTDWGGVRSVSKNKLRQHRSSEYKKKLNVWQSNFESRAGVKGKMTNNYHVSHRKPRKWAPWW
ncbi:discoidin domain-containing protein [Longispora urticae]